MYIYVYILYILNYIIYICIYIYIIYILYIYILYYILYILYYIYKNIYTYTRTHKYINIYIYIYVCIPFITQQSSSDIVKEKWNYGVEQTLPFVSKVSKHYLIISNWKKLRS